MNNSHLCCVLPRYTDLYGLLLFLGRDPYWVQLWWQKLLYEPYCHGRQKPLERLVAEVMWRTAKEDVLEQVLWKIFLVNWGKKISQLAQKGYKLNNFRMKWFRF